LAPPIQDFQPFRSGLLHQPSDPQQQQIDGYGDKREYDQGQLRGDHVDNRFGGQRFEDKNHTDIFVKSLSEENNEIVAAGGEIGKSMGLLNLVGQIDLEENQQKKIRLRDRMITL
jgi:hypothetical protein